LASPNFFPSKSKSKERERERERKENNVRTFLSNMWKNISDPPKFSQAEPQSILWPHSALQDGLSTPIGCSCSSDSHLPTSTRCSAVAILLLQHGLAILLLQQCLVLHLSWSGEPSSFNGRGVHAEKESLLPQAPSTAP
jgi:hypothetical protein